MEGCVVGQESVHYNIEGSRLGPHLQRALQLPHAALRLIRPQHLRERAIRRFGVPSVSVGQ